MALEAGVRGKAGWLALRSHLEGLLTLASVPSTSPLCLPKVLHSVLESQLLVVIVCVCQSVNLGTCVRAHTCVSVPCALLWVRTPLLVLSPVSCSLSASASERSCSWMPTNYTWAAGPALP